VPPLDDGVAGRIDLPPQHSVSFNYRAAGLFARPLEAGPYSIRFYFEAAPPAQPGEWAGLLQSDWVDFELVDQ
jgi:hypothetical protein